MADIYFLVGERSGDRHGSGLMAGLLAQASGEAITFRGLGGPEMHGISPKIVDWIEEAAVVGLVEVLKNYRFFRQRLTATIQDILTTKPDAVVLIDYPGFNLRLAEALRDGGYRGKILYYISPQVWAWHRSRIPKMARWLDLMLCIFPFEKALYQGYGLRTEFTGHPLVAWHRAQDAGQVRRTNLVGLFPGSRRREIGKIFTPMLQAAAELRARQPDLEFAASAASPKLAALMEEKLAVFPGLPVRIETGTVYTLMRTCTVGVVASGTATLEATILGLPYVLVYKVAWPTYVIGRQVIRVPHLGMANILAGKEIVPELLQNQCTGPNIAVALEKLITDPEAKARQLAEGAAVVAKLGGEQDAYRTAAKVVWQELRAGGT